MPSTQKIRVRFAPSPTGFLHVGGARTLLFNYLYARKLGGTLVLRIEDTDQARSTKASEDMIMQDVRKIGLVEDEGPFNPGDHAPYRQSERLPLYATKARELLDRDLAYYCFCSDAVLEQKRELAMKLGKPPHYDGTCAKTPIAEARARLAKGEKAGIRFRAYQKDYVLPDLVKGDVNFARGMVGDFFITRTPRENEKEIGEGIGMPVYNFCCVVDDGSMKISHVIRGDDHLSNTARQLMLYDAFGWETPKFAHCSTILGTDKQKLSKRNGDSSVHEYMDKGYLPEALLNFLALLGWWPKGDYKPKSGHPELLSIDELVSLFDTNGLQKAAAVFDVKKLQWMNGMYMRSLPLEEIAKRAKPFFERAIQDGSLPAGADRILAAKGDAWFKGIIDVVRGESTLLSDLPGSARIFFEAKPSLEPEAKTLLLTAETKPVVEALEAEIAGLPEAITDVLVDQFQKAVGAKTGAKGKGLFMPMRAAMTGRVHGPELKKVLPLLGKAMLMEHMKAVKAQLV